MTQVRLGERERERYGRQMIIGDFGEEAQLKLKAATVGVLGVGGLGSPACMYLAAAGVGHLLLIDDQKVERSNLNRQLLHWEMDATRAHRKVDSAAEKLKRLNHHIKLTLHHERVGQDNVQKLLGAADIVLDCTDNFETRMVLNDFCVQARKPFVHAGVEGWGGQITVIVPGRTACLRCLLPRTPGQRRSIPILGATAGVFGSMQAMEAVKFLTGVGQTLAGRMLLGDMSCNSWDLIEIQADPECPVCGR
jgi:molybdopterin/thiamine biosynthesis adenylyltransferase